MNYNKKHVEELGDAVETLEVLPTSTIKPIKVTLVRSIDQDTFEKAIEENDEEIKEVAEEAEKEEAEVEDQVHCRRICLV